MTPVILVIMGVTAGVLLVAAYLFHDDDQPRH